MGTICVPSKTVCLTFKGFKWQCFILMSKIEHNYKNCKIYDNSQNNDKVYVIYSNGCREAPFKVTRIAKISKFTKTATFTIYH